MLIFLLDCLLSISQKKNNLKDAEEIKIVLDSMFHKNISEGVFFLYSM